MVFVVVTLHFSLLQVSRVSVQFPQTSACHNAQGDSRPFMLPLCILLETAAKVHFLQKKNRASEYYDTADPFIDDSELAQDERTFFAQTKQKGFYVSSGQVALLNTSVEVIFMPSDSILTSSLRAPVTKKPKSKKVVLAPSASVAAALSSGPIPASLAMSLSQPIMPGPSKPPASSPKKVKQENGTRDEPIVLPSDNDETPAQGVKRKAEEPRSESVLSGSQDGAKKRRKTRELVSVELTSVARC